MADQMDLLVARLREAREESMARYLEQSRERLKKILKRKVMTSTVGAIATFEKLLGHLWGHGLPPAKLTPAQRAALPLWEEARRTIFTIGNAQVRAAEKELDRHTVRWDGYRLTLHTLPEEKDTHA